MAREVSALTQSPFHEAHALVQVVLAMPPFGTHPLEQRWRASLAEADEALRTYLTARGSEPWLSAIRTAAAAFAAVPLDTPELEPPDSLTRLYRAFEAAQSTFRQWWQATGQEIGTAAERVNQLLTLIRSTLVDGVREVEQFSGPESRYLIPAAFIPHRAPQPVQHP